MANGMNGTHESGAYWKLCPVCREDVRVLANGEIEDHGVIEGDDINSCIAGGMDVDRAEEYASERRMGA